MKLASKNLLRPQPYLRHLSTTIPPSLTEEEITKINTIIPHLISPTTNNNNNNLKPAINLITAALSTSNPPLNSLPLPPLISRLSHEPDLTYPMHFLNSLKYTTPQTLIPLIHVLKMLVSSFFRNDEPRKSVKVFQWLTRDDDDFGLKINDLEIYSVFVDGFCRRNGMVLEGVRVLRFMCGEGFVIGSEVREFLYKGMLREARVKEALEVNVALKRCGGGECKKEDVVGLLDRVIDNWTD